MSDYKLKERKKFRRMKNVQYNLYHDVQGSESAYVSLDLW
jgi:hypothetical protein